MTVPEDAARHNIGKYQVERILGEGAMGVVYLARDPHLERHVAIKVIRKDLLDRREAAQLIARFRNEAMAAARLSHPGIVAVYDFGEDEQASYIVMEYAPGDDLDEHVHKHGRLPLAQVGAVMAQLLDALHAAHAAGVVHRDIKPSNLVVTQGQIKIADFGVARVASSKLTQTGATIGTPMYMAPEQYNGAGVDHRADLFSAGIVFYELLTGHKPFSGETIHALAYQICHLDPQPPRAHVPSLPPAIDACVLKALAKDKEARYRSGREFAVAIHDALTGRAPAAAPPAIAPPPAQPWPPELLAAVEAVLVPVIGGLAGGLVRRSAARTTDRAELVELLRYGLGDLANHPTLMRDIRAALLGPGAATRPPVAPTPVPPPREAPAGLSPAELDRATQALVPHVGPIAKVLVKKAATQARDFGELCTRLTEHLTTDQERADFLKKTSSR